MSRALVAIITSALACFLAGCAQPATPDGPPIAAVHKVQCGRCHAPPEPKSHSRTELETAFGRHGKRVRLTHEEWQAMVDYLAPAAN